MIEPTKKPVLTKEHIAEVQKKLQEMQLKELKKGDVVKLNPHAAAWSVNYTT